MAKKKAKTPSENTRAGILGDRTRALLERESEQYWLFLQYQYDVRDKYLQFYMLVLAAVAALLATVADKQDSTWGLVALLGVTAFGFMTFLKVLYQRKRTAETKGKINAIRGELLNDATTGDKLVTRREVLGKILYPTTPRLPGDRKGDPSVFILVGGSTALAGAGATAYIVSDLERIREGFPWFPVAVSLMVISSGLWWWANRILREDAENVS